MLLSSGTLPNQDDLFPDSLKRRENECPDFQSASAALTARPGNVGAAAKGGSRLRSLGGGG